MKQEDIFSNSEGNKWYERNSGVLSSEAKRVDLPLKLIKMYGLKPKKVLEIGCSNGWRLQEIATQYGAKCVGIEPSTVALKAGAKQFPKVAFKRGLASNIPTKDTFDLVIVNFVLHWVSRELLLASIKEIDRTVADGGYLIIGDFAPDSPARTRYHHLPDEDVWTYKMDYARAFTATALYGEVARLTFDHDNHLLESATSDRRGDAVLLKKSLSLYYAEQRR